MRACSSSASKRLTLRLSKGFTLRLSKGLTLSLSKGEAGTGQLL